MDAAERYFQYSKDKVYLDKYPEQIIALDELKDKRILDIGAGCGNDLIYLLEAGLSPKDLSYLDSNPRTYSYAKSKLMNKGLSEDNIFLADGRGTGLRSSGFDVVYANNFIHCLGNIEEIQRFFMEAYRLLDHDGIIAGRTLFNEIYMEEVRRLDKEDFHRYTAHLLEFGMLVGLEPSNLESLAKPAGFSGFKYSIEDIPKRPIRNFYFRTEKR